MKQGAFLFFLLGSLASTLAAPCGGQSFPPWGSTKGSCDDTDFPWNGFNGGDCALNLVQFNTDRGISFVNDAWTAFNAEFPSGVDKSSSIYTSNDISPNIQFSVAGTLRFTWLGESAGFLNDVYAIVYDPATEAILSTQLIFKKNDFENHCNIRGQKFDIAYPAGSTVGIKLISQQDVSYYTINSLNPGGLRHFSAVPFGDTTVFGIEDVPIPNSDKDYNDVVYLLECVPPTSCQANIVVNTPTPTTPDFCPTDPAKVVPGRCGCGFVDAPLDVATDFGLFVFNNFTSQSSDIQTKVAIGKDLRPNTYNFGDPDCLGVSCPCEATVIVGRDAVLRSGALDNGYILYGRNATVFSTFSLPNCSTPLLKDETLPTSFFGPAETKLTALSDSLAALPTTGTTRYTPTGYFVNITNPAATFQVFSLLGNRVSGWGNGWKLSTFALDICNNLAPGTTVVININGAGLVSILGSDYTCLENYKVIFNINQATTLTISTYLPGTLLAPRAAVTRSSTGLIFGSAIVSSWDGTVQINKGNLFDGCIPA